LERSASNCAQIKIATAHTIEVDNVIRRIK
jgi:hypothetical protein